ncbi:MAG TPA: MMPL family transporter [Mycobacteriales bacterium]
MGVVDRLNALDERAGVAGPGSRRAYEQSVRLWWAAPATVAVAFAGLSVVSLVTATPVGIWVALPLLPATFWAGFFYNERLRALGRRPRYGRLPAEWPRDSPT